ncbi:MAG TPA: hypothetical protein PKC67_02600 [Kiritimatiellia bacterium]|nr:hypothetical protein [Kiritimatiellia bacterium]HMP33216.1 hypothetical protein [Kiritimatiellia bacterium]
MNRTEPSRNDYLASVLIPGWTQVMYFSPKWAAAFFVGAVVCWIFLPWPVAVVVHLAAMDHGARLVDAHFSGKRPATPEAWSAKYGATPRKSVH